LNLQRQCGVDAALAESWKIASRESELSLTSYETSLSIANEEIKILENNYQRVEDENKRLKEALYYADSIVYGTPGHTATATNSSHQHRVSRTSGSGNSGGGGVMKKNIRSPPSKVAMSTSTSGLTNDHRRCIYSR
jgi:hypothetical protein